MIFVYSWGLNVGDILDTTRIGDEKPFYDQ